MRALLRAIGWAAVVLLCAGASEASADSYIARFSVGSLNGPGATGFLRCTIAPFGTVLNCMGVNPLFWAFSPHSMEISGAGLAVSFSSQQPSVGGTVQLTPQQVQHLKAGLLVGVARGYIEYLVPETRTAPLLPEMQTPASYTLAEGATGAFFDTDLIVANLNVVPVSFVTAFLKEDGTTITLNSTLPPTSRVTIRVDDLAGLEATAASISVTSPSGLRLVVERTMRWGNGYGAHGEKATDGRASSFAFAEGAQGYFSTYLLLANPASAANVAHVTYLREGEPPLLRDYPLLPSSRRTVYAGADPELVNRSFATLVFFDQPAAAERVTYFGTNPFWSGGHASSGATSPSTLWYLAEGATGSFFSTYILLANQNLEDAHVTVTYLPSTGVPVDKTYVVGGQQRRTLDVAQQDPTLASTAVGARIESDLQIVVERSMYWPLPIWTEGHSSTAIKFAPASSWGLADGRVGGPAANQTYILLANPGALAADVTLTFIRDTGSAVVKTFTVPASSRFNVAVTGPGSSVPELADESFSTAIQSTQPIIVERSMYSNTADRIWAAGSNVTATQIVP